MKSRYKTYTVHTLDKEIHDASMKELEKYKDELYDRVSWDIFCQAVGVCLTALELMGWRKKRLTDFVNRVDDVTHIMFSDDTMGKSCSAKDCLKRMQEMYGIDLSKSQYKYEE